MATKQKKISTTKGRAARSGKSVLKKKKNTPKSKAVTLRTRLKKLAKDRNLSKYKAPPPLVRHHANPIIEPREHQFWEMKATFNPGAVYADNRIHLLYRAIGGDDVSVLGYAASDDGVNVVARSDAPAFIPVTQKKPADKPSAPVPAPAYSSGGGWNGGCEDPRLTLIDDNVYLNYTAFDGWGSIRIALTSIDLKNFIKQDWRWKEPVLISPPGEINKNWVLFPEKINGKFAILHSISPNILVDYFDSLDEFEREGKVIHSMYDRVSRTGSWDSWIRGAGPPPIKTRLGWLLFYHAMDIRDPNRYKLGAMILDINDPTKIIYRSQRPILEPDMDYENQGFKSGVVYSCGAVVKDGELFVYYGGGDSVSCVAMANMDDFLERLKQYGLAILTPTSKSRTNRDQK